MNSVVDPWHFGTVTDPDPGIFVSDLQDDDLKLLFFLRFFAYYFLKLHLHHYSKLKSYKEVTEQWELRFFLLFMLNYRRIRIHTLHQWIRIQDAKNTLIRIRNTDWNNRMRRGPRRNLLDVSPIIVGSPTCFI